MLDGTVCWTYLNPDDKLHSPIRQPSSGTLTVPHNPLPSALVNDRTRKQDLTGVKRREEYFLE